MDLQQLNNLPNFEFGQACEKALQRYFIQERGVNVLPVYKGDAPPLIIGPDTLIAPDLLCFKDGRSFWYEVKAHKHTSFFRRGGYYTTGCLLKKWHHYKAVQELTGIPVYMAQIHLNLATLYSPLPPIGVYGASIDSLEAMIDSSTEAFNTRWIYWRLDKLPLIVSSDKFMMYL